MMVIAKYYAEKRISTAFLRISIIYIYTCAIYVRKEERLIFDDLL